MGELLPCPFCGKSARIWQDPSHSKAFFIGCDDGETDCFGAIMWAESKTETIAAWNRRALPAASAEDVGTRALTWLRKNGIHTGDCKTVTMQDSVDDDVDLQTLCTCGLTELIKEKP